LTISSGSVIFVKTSIGSATFRPQVDSFLRAKVVQNRSSA